MECWQQMQIHWQEPEQGMVFEVKRIGLLKMLLGLVCCQLVLVLH